eukprot:702255-Pelagomonas_calceolata.AAC.10
MVIAALLQVQAHPNEVLQPSCVYIILSPCPLAFWDKKVFPVSAQPNPSAVGGQSTSSIPTGYKFNILYHDLIDKSKAPQYVIEEDPQSADRSTCILRFKPCTAAQGSLFCDGTLQIFVTMGQITTTLMRLHAQIKLGNASNNSSTFEARCSYTRCKTCFRNLAQRGPPGAYGA